MAKIMIVDDHEDIVDTLRTIAKRLDHEVSTALNGKEFLEKISSVEPELILLDVMMPGLTTKEILSKITEKGFGNIPVFLITVVKFSEEEKSELQNNFKIVEFVQKPFGVLDLITKLKKHLNQI